MFVGMHAHIQPMTLQEAQEMDCPAEGGNSAWHQTGGGREAEWRRGREGGVHGNMTKGAKRETSDEDTHVCFLVNGPDPMALSGPINGTNESRPGSRGPFPENLARAGHMGRRRTTILVDAGWHCLHKAWEASYWISSPQITAPLTIHPNTRR